jgi:hypothetical protein
MLLYTLPELISLGFKIAPERVARRCAREETYSSGSCMYEGEVHCLRHGPSMEDSIATGITSEMTHEHICNPCAGIWEENNIVDIRCDDLVYETREVIPSITSS